MKNKERQSGHMERKKIILGVSFSWGKRKGLDVFIKMRQLLDQSYIIVLVGVDDSIKNKLPQGIIPVQRTQNQAELAEIYTAADVFVNPTREEVLGMVNVEALACGTPVVTFNSGGSPETIDGTCGVVVECDDICEMINRIKQVSDKNTISDIACLKRAKKYDERNTYQSYMKLYG